MGAKIATFGHHAVLRLFDDFLPATLRRPRLPGGVGPVGVVDHGGRRHHAAATIAAKIEMMHQQALRVRKNAPKEAAFDPVGNPVFARSSRYG